MSTHHKQVDDQVHTWTTAELRQRKTKHEAWVAASLSQTSEETPVRIRRATTGPIAVQQMTSGRDLLATVERGLAFFFDHDELQTEYEVDVVGAFLQELRDWGDIGADLEPSERVKETFRIGESLKELADAGFAVLGGTDSRALEGGTSQPTSFPVAVVKVVRVNGATDQRATPDENSRR